MKKEETEVKKPTKPTLDDLLNNNDPRAHKSRATTSQKVQNGASTTLFMGELALGTKACDPRFYQGLTYFLEANDLDHEIGHVVMSGGLLPLIPTFYGVQMAREMVFLGNNWDQEINDLSKMAFKSGVSDEDKDFILKWVAYKITNTSQAVENSRQVMAPLTGLLNDGAVWHYLHGEEDNKNIEMLLEININNYIDTQRAQEQDEKKKAALDRELERLQAKAKEYDAQSTLLRDVRQGIKPNDDKDAVNKYLTSFMKEKAKEIDTLEDSEKFKKFLSSVTSRKKISERVEKLDAQLKNLREKNRDKNRELKDTTNDLNARKRQMESSQFHRITKRQHIKPHENELLRMEAKREYQDHLYSSLPGVNVKVHGGNEVDLLLDSVPVTLAHKVQLRSSTPAMAEVDKTRIMMFNRRQQGLPVSDINVSFHGAGGFRAVPVNTRPETIEAAVERETPHIGMAMQLPTMQLVSYLETLKRKSIKNDHTRRYESGMYSSGAVLYRVEPTGEHSIRMITTEQMLEAYAVGEQVRELKKKASASKGEEKEKLKEQIKGLEAKLKIKPRKKALLTDIHLGAPNKDGRPSNYEMLEAANNYLEKNGWPNDLVINGDIAHGALERHFGSNEQYLAPPPSEVSAEIQKIMNSDKGEKEKAEALAYFCQRNVSQMLPISVVSLQMREIKQRLAPMIHKTLDNGGHVTITSGNHYNETTKFLDEATDIVNAVDLKYLGNPHLHEFTGFGERFGMGEATFHETTLEGGWKTYACHGPGSGTDFVQAALKKLFKANKDINEADFGHVHVGGAGHAGKTFVTVGPGWQPWVHYVDQLGQQASLRGFVLTERDLNKKGYFGWKFVLDPTLERPEYTPLRQAL